MIGSKQRRGRRLPPENFTVRFVSASSAPALSAEQLRRGFDVLFPPLPVADPATPHHAHAEV